MTLKQFVFILAPAVVLTACGTDSTAPPPSKLVGSWSTAAESLGSGGSLTRELTFSASGQYVTAVKMRGVYHSLPADSVGSYTLTYGSYELSGNVLHLVQDSVITWDFVSGYHKQSGPLFYFEGPPTDPVVSLKFTTLVLRFRVNPGNGYVDVEQVYHRS